MTPAPAGMVERTGIMPGGTECASEARNGNAPTAPPLLTLVAAVARNGVIGRGNALPWRLPGDLRFFKRTTMGKPVVMGRRTWESIGGRPLPGRSNIVLTRDTGFAPEGAIVCHGFVGAIAEARRIAAGTGALEICVIGGESLFAEALRMADRLYLTEVLSEPAGDVLFPPFDRGAWTATELERADAAGPDSPAYRILRLDRKH